ncbi:replication initiation factor domain-containing protein [Oceanobacillus oncorhynchi subsp. oncorhynchi]|uniref:replication initiation factor domain-containing protein n=1 Tax=Oceanobacillus oncorhynchi TaxID=545501 RepID=UPI003638C495
MSNIGTSIKTTRERLGIKAVDFAKEIGVTSAYLSMIESGKRKIPDNLKEEMLDTLAYYDANEKSLECIYDYIRISFPTHDVDSILKDILHIKKEFMYETATSQYGYVGMFKLDLIKCLYSEKGDDRGTLIEMSGKGCRQFESYLQARGKTWFDFFSDCERFKGRCTRIDIAINDFKAYVSIPTLLNKIFAGECVSKFRAFDFMGSGLIDSGEKNGVSIYLGSKSSDFYLCLYQKDYEQAKKLNIPIEDVEIKNRYELRLKNERAQELIRLIQESGIVSENVIAVLNNYVRFVDKGTQKAKKHWQVNKKWENLIGEMGKKLKLTTEPTEDFYEKSEAWVEKSVAPTLKMIQSADEELNRDKLNEMINNAEMSEEQEHKMMIYVTKVEDMIA